jgi:polyisoprenoid-binding protein YceI
MSTYKIDAAHSEIGFKVKHLMITNVAGQFKTFDATMTSTADDFSDAKISFEADVNSVDTNQPQRDEHLKSGDFFAATEFPKLTFVSTNLEKKSGDDYILNGELTMRGVTKPVSLNVEFGGAVTDPYGQQKAGFEISGKINRKDFGVSFGAVTETGGVLLADDVKLNMSVQMIKQTAA